MPKIFIMVVLTTLLNARVLVLVSQDNRLNSISSKELSNLYLKKIDRINGKKIIIINNKDDYDEFNKKILNKNSSQIHAYWMKQIFLGKRVPPEILSNIELQEKVKNSKDTIGYSSKNLHQKVIYETK